MKQTKINWHEIISYLFFGGLATVVNFIVFFVCKNFGWDYKINNAIAWLFAVSFAYGTNKYFVFKSQKQTTEDTVKELGAFFSVRTVSLGIDMISMVTLIEYLKVSDFWAKVITQILIVVTNYAFSKWFVFKKKTPKNG